MPDVPDYSRYGVQSVRFSLQDLGELAPRLGSANWYNRLGNVILNDDFSCGMTGYSQLINASPSTLRVAAYSENQGGYSALLLPSAVAGAYAALEKFIAPNRLGRHGFEFSAALITTVDNIVAQLEHDTAPDGLLAGIKIDIANTRIQLYDDSGSYVTVVPSFDFRTVTNMFYHFKLVVDFNTRKYVRLLVNEFTYDISTYSFQLYNVSVSSRERASIRANGTGAGAGSVAVGTFILTTDEP